MKGVVDSGGRSLINILVASSDAPKTAEVQVWIDTGFTGDLVMPQTAIDGLGLTKSGSIDAVLADGSQTELSTYSCLVEWFGNKRSLEVIANDGQYPLLGVGLLLGLELCIDYRNLKVTLEPSAE